MKCIQSPIQVLDYKEALPQVEATTNRLLTETNCFLKDVCLLPSPSYNKVPRREAKLELQKHSLYIDAFTFDKRWDEKVLREKMWQLFSTQSTEIDLEDNTR